jgi:hypothetical protein
MKVWNYPSAGKAFTSQNDASFIFMECLYIVHFCYLPHLKGSVFSGLPEEGNPAVGKEGEILYAVIRSSGEKGV